MMHGIGESGTDHDFFAYDSTGKVWDGSAFVAPVAADYLDYRIAATEDGLGNFSAAAPEGMTRYELRVRGASLAESYVVWTGDLSNDVAAILTAIKADAELGTGEGGMVANAAAAATQSAIASAQSTTAATQSTIAANAAVSAPASTVSLLKIDEDFGKDPGGLLENAIAARKLAEADDLLESVGGVQVLNKYERGTSNKLVPTKSAKKVGGGDLTNPTSQRWAGYREEA